METGARKNEKKTSDKGRKKMKRKMKEKFSEQVWMKYSDSSASFGKLEKSSNLQRVWKSFPLTF